MKILMLGWEFPPNISGGLGTACQGIVNGLGNIPNTNVIFVVPKVFGDEKAENTVFAGANKYVEQHSDILNRKIRITISDDEAKNDNNKILLKDAKNHLVYIETASFLHPYIQAEQLESILKKRNINPDSVWFDSDGRLMITKNGESAEIKIGLCDLEDVDADSSKFEFTGKYTSQLYTETGMFAHVTSELSQEYDFDVIHAHDWLTYEAGIAAKESSGKPLVVHVHATEYDRSGGNVNPRVFEIEKHGMQAADSVVTVSNLTRDTVINKYGIEPEKVHTIYNAVDFKPVKKAPRNPNDPKIVTFLGRITHQKGPMYFLKAAFHVLQRTQNVRFVMAGNGDMFHYLIKEAARLHIADRFHFTDFLDREDVRRLMSVSDVFVMPSVSEPFGIVPLEAIKSGVPVIISKQSGVAEVLNYALKVDYWDVAALADSIYSLIKYPVLSNFLIRNGREEVSSMKWDTCAGELFALYQSLVKKETENEVEPETDDVNPQIIELSDNLETLKTVDNSINNTLL